MRQEQEYPQSMAKSIQAQKTPHVTICMTTISSRIESVHKTIASLLKQNYGNFSIRLYLSSEPWLLDDGVNAILPDKLQALLERHADKFSVWFVPNIGSYRKIIPFLYQTLGHRRLVATADDDTIYPEDWLSRLVETYQSRRCVICYRGHFMVRKDGDFSGYRSWMTHGIERNPDLYIIPTGKDGVLYDTAFFHPGVLDYHTAMDISPTADDLWLKLHTAAVDVPTYTIHTDYASETLDSMDYEKSLYLTYNKGGKNDETIANLRRYAEDTLLFDFAGRF